MSSYALSKILNTRGLRPREFRILFNLADATGENGEVSTSIGFVAERCEMSHAAFVHRVEQIRDKFTWASGLEIDSAGYRIAGFLFREPN